MLMVGRAILTVINDDTKAQTLQVSLLADEVRDDVERFQEYGFTSVPGSGVEGVAVFVGGNRSHGIVVATEDRENRPTGLNEGEVALYTSHNGKRVYLKDDGEVHLGTDPTDPVALAPATKAELEKLKSELNAFMGVYGAHIHTTTATEQATTTVGTISAPAAQGVPGVPVGEIAATEVKAK
jgi:phage gp45-like